MKPKKKLQYKRRSEKEWKNLILGCVPRYAEDRGRTYTEIRKLAHYRGVRSPTWFERYWKQVKPSLACKKGLMGEERFTRGLPGRYEPDLKTLGPIEDRDIQFGKYSDRERYPKPVKFVRKPIRLPSEPTDVLFGQIYVSYLKTLASLVEINDHEDASRRINEFVDGSLEGLRLHADQFWAIREIPACHREARRMTQLIHEIERNRLMPRFHAQSLPFS